MLLDKVVVGHSLDSVMYALKSDAFLVFNAEHLPFEFKKLDPCVTYAERDFLFERELLSNILVEMALSARLVNSAPINKVRIDGNTVGLYFDARRPLEFECSEIVVGEANMLSCENKIIKMNRPSAVYDWMNALTAAQHDLDTISLESEYVEKVLFFESKRPDVPKGFKDAVVVSRMSEKDLQNFECSGTYFRILLERKMKELGIKIKNGTSNGGKPIFKYPQFSPPRRIVVDETIYRVVSGGPITRLDEK